VQNRDLGPVHSNQPEECPYAAGDVVPDSGIYELCHEDGPADALVFIRGNIFPECACCGAKARYRLLRAAPYLMEDPDFGGSGTL
jgi:hypothetical protein